MTIALHSVSIRYASGALLEIEWTSGVAGQDVVLQNGFSFERCTLETQPGINAFGDIFPIAWRPERYALFEPLQLREETEYAIDVTLPGSIAGHSQRWEDDHSWPLRGLEKVYSSDPPRRWREEGGHIVIGGRLNFRSYAGVAEFRLSTQDVLRVEVAPKKLAYFDDFRELLESVASEFVELVLQLDAPTSAPFGLTDVRARRSLVLLFHLRRIFADSALPAAIDQILNRPHSSLKTRDRSESLVGVYPEDAYQITERGELFDVVRGGLLARLFGGFTPRELLVRHRVETADTAENRYVKNFLEVIRQDLDELAESLRKAESHALNEVFDWRTTVDDWLSDPLWRDVERLQGIPTNSQVLQRRTGYRDVLAADASLQAGIEIPWKRGEELADGLDGTLRPVSELYQYWCFFILRRLIASLCDAVGKEKGELIVEAANTLELQLRAGFESRIEFLYTTGDGGAAKVTLFYNKTFAVRSANDQWDGSYAGEYVPDYSLMISLAKDLGPVVHWLHFDAKYRLSIRPGMQSVATEGISVEPVPSVDILPRPDTLEQMHAYRDALLGSRGAFVLYPGDDIRQVFVRQPRSSRQKGLPAVGAFPLRPGGPGAQQEELRAFLKQALETVASAQGPYQEETGFPQSL